MLSICWIDRADRKEIDPEDHATLDALAPAAHGEGGKTLADLIFSKMEGGAVTQGIEEEGVFYRYKASMRD